MFLQCTGEMTFIVSKCAEMLFWHQELRTCSIEKPLPKTGVCNSYPCKNDGECLDLGGSNFKCLCKSGYTGSLCESAIDFCLNNPCSYGGRCVSHPNGYNCICADKVVDESCATGKQRIYIKKQKKFIKLISIYLKKVSKIHAHWDQETIFQTHCSTTNTLSAQSMVWLSHVIALQV